MTTCLFSFYFTLFFTASTHTTWRCSFRTGGKANIRNKALLPENSPPPCLHPCSFVCRSRMHSFCKAQPKQMREFKHRNLPATTHNLSGKIDGRCRTCITVLHLRELLHDLYASVEHVTWLSNVFIYINMYIYRQKISIEKRSNIYMYIYIYLIVSHQDFRFDHCIPKPRSMHLRMRYGKS